MKITTANSASFAGHAKAFTLIELLVVIGIIVLLLGILIPTISGAKRRARISATYSEFTSIGLALEAYKSDFNVYPDSGTGNQYLNSTTPLTSGMNRLAEGILGYLDAPTSGSVSADGAGITSGDSSPLGFRMNGHGQIHGPYMNITQNTANTKGNYSNGGNYSNPALGAFTGGAFLDAWGNPIYYYRANVPPTGQYFFDTGSGGVFIAADNPGSPAASAAFLNRVGDTNGNNAIDSGELVTGRTTYLLVSPGPDGNYFTGDDLLSGQNR